MSKKLELSGQRFGKLVAIRENGKYTSPSGNTLILWECKCDCGKTKNIRGSYLKKGMSKSCGCQRIIYTCKKAEKESNFNSIYYHYKKRASLKNLDFEISKEEFKSLTSQNCFYCGIEPYNKTETQQIKLNSGYYIYNGIDRIDSLTGYTKENCVSCCKVCNYAKHTMTLSSFKLWVNRVYNHLKNED